MQFLEILSFAMSSKIKRPNFQVLTRFFTKQPLNKIIFVALKKTADVSLEYFNTRYIKLLWSDTNICSVFIIQESAPVVVPVAYLSVCASK